jgi:hypothetical protein
MLNIAVPDRPRERASALLPPLSQAGVEGWRTATRALINPSPSSFGRHVSLPELVAPLPERLFDALAACKLTTARLAVAHLTSDERARLFKHLDSLLDPDSWDDADQVPSEASFTTLLRMMLYLGGRRPALGITSTGNFIATWSEGDGRLTIECRPKDEVRWVLVHSLDGRRESAAGETVVRRLPQVLNAYDPPRRWFPNATHQVAT